MCHRKAKKTEQRSQNRPMWPMLCDKGDIIAQWEEGQLVQYMPWVNYRSKCGDMFDFYNKAKSIPNERRTRAGHII